MTPNKRLELLNKLTHCGGGSIPLSGGESRYKAPPVFFDGEFYRINRGQEPNWLNWTVDRHGHPLIKHRYKEVDRRILQLAREWGIIDGTDEEGYSKGDRRFLLSDSP